MSKSEAASRLVYEFYPTEGVLPIHYSIAGDNVDMKLSGNDFKLTPDNVQYYFVDASRSNGANRYYKAQVKVDLKRGYDFAFSTSDPSAAIDSSTLVEDISHKESNGEFRTVQVWEVVYRRPASEQSDRGNITVTASAIRYVNYSIDTMEGPWNPTDPNVKKNPFYDSYHISDFGQSRRVTNGMMDGDYHAYENQWGYTRSNVSANVSRAVNPFILKVIRPSDLSSDGSRDPRSRGYLPDEALQSPLSSGLSGNDRLWALSDNWVPEKWSGSYDKNATHEPGFDKTIDFYVQQNGLPSQLLNGSVAATHNLVTWNYFLSRVSVNGEWIPVPQPAVPQLEWNYSSERDYRNFRDQMIGGLDTTAFRYQSNFNSSMGNDDRSYFRCWYNSVNDEMTDDAGVRIYNPETYRKPFFSYTYNFGPLAGAKLEISLVNIRNSADSRAGGRYRSEASAKAAWAGSTRGGNTDWQWATSGSDGNEIQWDSGQPPSFAPGTQMLDLSPCSRWYDYEKNFFATESNGAENKWSSHGFRIMNTWKTLYRIRISNVDVSKLEVHTRFDATANGRWWNAGSQGIYWGSANNTFGAAITNASNTGTTYEPICSDASLETGCREAQTYSGAGALDPTQPVRFKLRPGYGLPVADVLARDATGQSSSQSAFNTLHVGQGTGDIRWDAKNGYYYFSGPSPMRANYKAQKPSWTNYRQVGRNMSLGIRVRAEVIDVPVNYRPAATSSDLLPNFTNGQIANRVYANKITVQGPLPLLSNKKSAGSFSLYGIPAAGGSPEELATALVPGSVVDLNTLGTNGLEMVVPSTGAAKYSQLVLVPVESGPATVVGTHLAYPLVRYLGRIAPDAAYDKLGDFAAVPGLKVEMASSWVPGVLTVNGLNYNYSPEKSVTERTLTAALSGLDLVFMPEVAPVIINKKWVYTTTDGTAAEAVDGAQPAQFSAEPTIDGQAARFGAQTTNTYAGQAFTLSENLSKLEGYPLCRVVSSTLTGSGVNLSANNPKAGNSDESGWTDNWTPTFTVPNNGKPDAAKGSVGATNVTVTYQFRSGDPTRSLPAGITNLRPASSGQSVGYGTTVAPPALSQNNYPDSTNKGTWTFDGWNQTAFVARDNTTITGTWSFHPDEPNVTWLATGYAWQLPAGATGVDPSLLRGLPANTAYKVGGTEPDAPANPSPSSITTAAGTYTFDKWVSSGNGWTGVWKAPATKNVTYTYTVTDLGTRVLSDYMKKLMAQALPANTTANLGQVVKPAAPRSLVVNGRGATTTTTDDFGDGSWGTLRFVGWNETQATVGDQGATFTATYQYVDMSWDRAIILSNAASEDSKTAGDVKMAIPTAIKNEMSNAMNKSGILLRPGGKNGQPWTAPDWTGVSYRDDLNGGRWEFVRFDRTSATFADFEQTTGRDRGTDENIWIENNGNGTVHNWSLPVTAFWKFVPDRSYTMTNRVDCKVRVITAKTVGGVTNALDGAMQTAGVGAFSRWIGTDENDKWKFSGSGDQWRPLANQRDADLISGTSIELNEGPTSDVLPSTYYALNNWTCTPGGWLSGQNTANAKVTLHYALGSQVKCTADNRPAQVTLLTNKENTSEAVTGVTLKATPNNSDWMKSIPTISVQGDATTATVDNTKMARPNRTYTLTEEHPFGVTFLRFERYTGSAPNGEVLAEDKWEPVAPIAGGGSGTAVTATSTTTVVPAVGAHEVYRAVYDVQPPAAYFDLPLTGGLGRDGFILVGLGAIFMALTATGILKYRRRHQVVRA